MMTYPVTVKLMHNYPHSKLFEMYVLDYLFMHSCIPIMSFYFITVSLLTIKWAHYYCKVSYIMFFPFKYSATLQSHRHLQGFPTYNSYRNQIFKLPLSSLTLVCKTTNSLLSSAPVFLCLLKSIGQINSISQGHMKTWTVSSDESFSPMVQVPFLILSTHSLSHFTLQN